MADTTNQPAASASEDLIDLRELTSTFRRRFWSFLATGVLTFVAIVLFTLQATPKYTAKADVVLNVRQSQVVDIEAVLSGAPPDSAMVDTEVEVLRSRSLAETVVNDLNLVAVPEFNTALREREGLGGWTASIIGGLKSVLAPSGAESLSDDERRAREHDLVVNALMDARDIRRAGLTYVIEISATSETPSLARDIANAYADAYLLTQLEAKFEATERANEWLNDRVETLREEVRIREEAVARYRDDAGLIDAEGATVAEQQVTDLNSQLAIQRASLSEARARLDTVRSQIERGVAADTIAEVLSSEVVRELRRQQAEVARRLADLSGRYGPRHPQILTVNRELSDINSQIDAEITRIVASLENEVSVAAQRVRSLQNSLIQARSELSENNSAIVQLRELEREADASRALFESFLNRFRQTNETEGLTEADARVVARASTPINPSSPRVLLNLVLGVVLAGVFGVGVVFALEMFDNGLHTETDVERQLGLPHIVSVPRLKPGLMGRLSGNSIDPGDYVLQKPLSSFAESFRTVRSAIRLSGVDQDTRTVAITSALPGDGKTTTSLCLGRVSALAGSKTIVVDCDLRRRLLTHAVCDDAEQGLLEVLSGQAKLQDVIEIEDETGLAILPVIAPTFTPRDMFDSAAFAEVLAQLRETYDLVIIDTAPVLAVADTRLIASRVDAVLVAAKWKKTPSGVVRRAVNELQSVHAKVMGVVLNNVDMEAQARYGYDSSGYYYNSYRKYYSE